MNTYTRGEGNLVTCGERIVCDAFSGADANRIVCEHNAHGDMLKALRDLVADKYLSDPINTERMAPARDAIAKAEGCK